MAFLISSSAIELTKTDSPLTTGHDLSSQLNVKPFSLINSSLEATTSVDSADLVAVTTKSSIAIFTLFVAAVDLNKKKYAFLSLGIVTSVNVVEYS